MLKLTNNYIKNDIIKNKSYIFEYQNNIKRGGNSTIRQKYYDDFRFNKVQWKDL